MCNLKSMPCSGSEHLIQRYFIQKYFYTQLINSCCQFDNIAIYIPTLHKSKSHFVIYLQHINFLPRKTLICSLSWHHICSLSWHHICSLSWHHICSLSWHQICSLSWHHICSLSDRMYQKFVISKILSVSCHF